MFLYDSFYCHVCVFYDFPLMFSGPSNSLEDLISFFGHVCYRLFFSLVLCFKMMILEEPFERFSLDLLILSRTLSKTYYSFCFIVIVGFN